MTRSCDIHVNESRTAYRFGIILICILGFQSSVNLLLKDSGRENRYLEVFLFPSNDDKFLCIHPHAQTSLVASWKHMQDANLS